MSPTEKNPTRKKYGISDKRLAAFRKKLWRWWSENKREFPWRRTTDPYRILVSEITLQQTQASRAAIYYERFVARFPDVGTLARARRRSVLALWRGLGYNRRAAALHEAAKEIVRRHGGEVPSDREALLALPGVGSYTAGAVLAFAFNKSAPTADANIRRVLISEFDLPRDIRDGDVERLAFEMAPRGRAREWNAAMMDYGALVATSRRTGVSPKTKQSKFEGSRRQLRGKVLRALLEEPIDERALRDRFDDPRLGGVLEDMRREGLTTERNGIWRSA
ncbi:MAG: Fe-S cluster assembly protein HesB [Ignavibacteriales bacterium]|nr:Fe-S cluster assembly protein HesB [Ignavibacteriales bacterium]